MTDAPPPLPNPTPDEQTPAEPLGRQRQAVLLVRLGGKLFTVGRSVAHGPYCQPTDDPTQAFYFDGRTDRRAIEALLSAAYDQAEDEPPHPDALGIAVKTLEGRARLCPADPTVVDEPTARTDERDPDEVPTVRPAPVRRTLAEVEAVFRAHFEGFDVMPLRATLATYYANIKMPGDPVWLLLVGGSSTGKTETGTSIMRLPLVTIGSSISGEAALLSGTSRSERAADASGGLLRQVGRLGVLVLKDFTSIISMHRDRRAEVLAALREVFDGGWSRLVGVDGGRQLEWRGKLGIIACCTSVIDGAHAVISSLGDRFLYIRLPDDEREAIGRTAIGHAGLEPAVRAEIADAVTGLLFADDGPQPLEFTTDDLNRLARLANYVTMARSPVERDIKGEISLVLDREGPARFAKEVAQIYRACGAIGLSRSEAWDVAARIGRDSIPKLRWAVIAFLLAIGTEAGTARIAQGVKHPTRSTRRALEDLTAHGIVLRRAVKNEAGPSGSSNMDMWCLTGNATNVFSQLTPRASFVPPSTPDTSREAEQANEEDEGGGGNHPNVGDKTGTRGDQQTLTYDETIPPPETEPEWDDGADWLSHDVHPNGGPVRPAARPPP